MSKSINTLEESEEAKTPSPIIDLRSVSKVYGKGHVQVRALNSIDLVVRRGDFLAVMGPSGSGKSTAIQIIGCLDRPSSGHYTLNGQSVERLTENALATIRNRQLGFVFQQFHLIPNLSALDNVILPMVFAGIPRWERRDRACMALRRVGLGNRLDNRPNQLSGGEQQRVAIARSIVNGPGILLADEPTGNLDSRTTDEVLEIFQDLHESQGMTIILVTHEQKVASLADKIIHFRDGQIIS